MARTFDARFLLDILPSFWREFYGDRARLIRFWEGFVRLLDDEWAQAEQLNDSADASTCPTFIYHTYLYRYLDLWQSNRLPHTHFRKDFRATAGQTIFYIGAWPDPAASQVFLNGKEVDPGSEPFILTFDQDPTQPGTNPAGARLLFSNPVALNTPVSVFSDRELTHVEVEVPSTGLTSVVFPRDVDPDSVRVVLKKFNVTRFLNVQSDGFEWNSLPSTDLDTREFKRGERFEIIDGATTTFVTLSRNTQKVQVSITTPGTAVIYKILDLDISDGKIGFDGPFLRVYEQSFPVCLWIRASDAGRVDSRHIDEGVSSINFGDAFDPNTIKVFSLGGLLVDGFVATEQELAFVRSFTQGVVILVEASFVDPNDHAVHRVVASGGQVFSVPATRPFNLSGGVEQTNYPVQVLLNGALLHPDRYTFLSATAIQMVASVTVGSIVDFRYVDVENPVDHMHVRETHRIPVPTRSIALDGYLSDTFPYHITVNGLAVSDPTKWVVGAGGRYVIFAQALGAGSVVKVAGAHSAFRFYHDIDPEIVRAEFLQNGIDERSTAIPNGWTIQLAWDDGFLITDGLLEANEKINNAWFVNVDVDERTAYRNYGCLIDLDRETSDEYVAAVRALMAARYMGSKPEILENFSCILMGSQYLRSKEKVQAISGTQVTAPSGEYSLDPDLPSRVEAGKTYERFHALSQFVRINDEWEAFRELPVIAGQFSPNYTYSKTLDIHRSTTYDGGNCIFNRGTDLLEDLNTDFFLEQVWPGDLLVVYTSAAPTVPLYGRVIRVTRHGLEITVGFPGGPSYWGYGYWGQWAYGAGSLIIPIDRYRIWVRDTDRLDVYRHLDEALEEDVPYLMARTHDLLSHFVFLAEIAWAGIRDEQALDDVKNFLDKAKPSDTAYIAYTRVGGENGIQDSVQGNVVDSDPQIDQYVDWAFVSSVLAGIVGGNGQTSPNVGSFISP